MKSRITDEANVSYLLSGSKKFIAIMPFEEYLEMKIENEILKVLISRLKEKSITKIALVRKLRKILDV